MKGHTTYYKELEVKYSTLDWDDWNCQEEIRSDVHYRARQGLQNLG